MSVNTAIGISTASRAAHDDGAALWRGTRRAQRRSGAGARGSPSREPPAARSTSQREGRAARSPRGAAPTSSAHRARSGRTRPAVGEGPERRGDPRRSRCPTPSVPPAAPDGPGGRPRPGERGGELQDQRGKPQQQAAEALAEAAARRRRCADRGRPRRCGPRPAGVGHRDPRRERAHAPAGGGDSAGAGRTPLPGAI